MIIVEIRKGESIEVALKKLKYKFRRIKITEQLRENQYYDKPSVKKRAIKQKAIYIQKLRDQEDNNS
jgi:small subunit ribosomal protein S21